MTLRNLNLSGLLFLLCALPLGIKAQTAAAIPGCTVARHEYTCNRGLFQTALGRTKTAAIDISPRDRMARTQLEELIAGLGKTLQPANAPADLIFVVVHPEAGEVEIGPADQDLGSLLVYAGGIDSQRGGLLWGDTLRGQADMPWPAVVHALIQRFQEKFSNP